MPEKIVQSESEVVTPWKWLTGALVGGGLLWLVSAIGTIIIDAAQHQGALNTALARMTKHYVPSGLAYGPPSVVDFGEKMIVYVWLGIVLAALVVAYYCVKSLWHYLRPPATNQYGRGRDGKPLAASSVGLIALVVVAFFYGLPVYRLFWPASG